MIYLNILGTFGSSPDLVATPSIGSNILFLGLTAPSTMGNISPLDLNPLLYEWLLSQLIFSDQR